MSKSSYSPIATTIDNIIAYGTPDGAGVVRFDMWQKRYAEAGLDGPAVLANLWKSTLAKQGVRTPAEAETKLGHQACEIAIKYGFLRGERVDRTGVSHTPECKIMWMLYREDAKKPGVVRAAERGEYGWLRQTMIGVLEQVKIVYGAEILTSDGKVMIDVLREALIEARDFWALKGTRFDVNGYTAVSDEAKKYMARARAAAKRVITEVEAIAPNGVLCSCGRTHGEVVEAPVEVVDMSAPDGVSIDDDPSRDEIRDLTHGQDLLDVAEAGLKMQGYIGRSLTMKMCSVFGVSKKDKLMDGALAILHSTDRDAKVKSIMDLAANF